MDTGRPQLEDANIRSAQLPARIVALLEQAIVSGELKGGERLEEVGLATRYGVSRTPVREALRELASRGLVEVRSRRGAVVCSRTPADLAEMFEAMAELEAGCVNLAARRANARDFARIGEAQMACHLAAGAGKVAAYALANERFHHALYDASHNRYLIEAAHRLYARLEPYRRLLLGIAERRGSSLVEHEAILEALMEGDAANAKARVKAHVSILGERFTALAAAIAAVEPASPTAPGREGQARPDGEDRK